MRCGAWTGLFERMHEPSDKGGRPSIALIQARAGHKSLLVLRFCHTASLRCLVAH